MSTSPDKLSQFWNELKRRKVVRVITVYSASAFVILELADIIIEPFGLPDWTLKLVVVLLSLGLIVSLILSWIYDISPEGGLERTKPAQVAQEKSDSSNSWKAASYVSFIVIVGLIIFNILSTGNKSGASSILEKSIAVLPFTNLSEEKGNDHFTDGLVEDLLNRISVLKDLKVISRTSSEMFRERGVKSVPEIAHELGDISYIVVGSVQRYGDKARITVQLVDAINDDNIWAENYDRAIVDVFKTQSEIAMQIASELNTILTSEQKTHIQDHKTENVRAFELYQMGRFNWDKRTDDGLTTSIEYFEKAIAEDPGYGLAVAGLADAYAIMAAHGWMDRKEGIDKAEMLALKALELDGNLAEAYTVRGLLSYMNWEWEKSEQAFKRALELNPNYAIAHAYYAHLLSYIGRNKEARKHMDIALELDPFSFNNRDSSARFYYHRGNFSEALKEIQICHELQQDHIWIPTRKLMNYFQLGEEEKAYAALGKILNSSAIYDIEIADKIFNEDGLKAVLEWKIEVDLKDAGNYHNSYYDLANSYGMIGEDEKALYWLEKAFTAHQTEEIYFNIHFRNLHNNPRYLAILKGMGLEMQ